MYLLRALASMLPRLRAEERLASITDGLLASGQMNASKARGVLRRIERDATSGVRRKRAAPATTKGLQSMGINVEVRE